MDPRGSFKTLLLFLILVLTVTVSNATKNGPHGRHSKVLILGAGMSGITAAKTPHEGGVNDFTIIEGYGDIGGRMRKVEFADTIVELGANWVQGLKNNPIWDLAQKYELKGNYTVAYPEPGYYIVRNESGEDVTSQDNHEEMSKASDRLDEIVKERRALGMADIDVQTGLRLAGWQSQNTAQSSIEYFCVDFDAADRPHYVSARVKSYTNGSIDSEGGKQFFVFDKRGYAVLVEEMAKSFLEPKDPRLLVNQVVDNIKWDDNGVEVSTTTGEMFTADYLLITFSIGVLKSNAVKFTPDLPAKILEPIYKIEMADYIKIFLKFPSRFWDKKQYILYASKR